MPRVRRLGVEKHAPGISEGEHAQLAGKDKEDIPEIRAELRVPIDRGVTSESLLRPSAERRPAAEERRLVEWILAEGLLASGAKGEHWPDQTQVCGRLSFRRTERLHDVPDLGVHRATEIEQHAALGIAAAVARVDRNRGACAELREALRAIRRQ